MDVRRYQEIRRAFMMLEAVALAATVVVIEPPRRDYIDDFKPLPRQKRRDYPTIAELSGRRRFIKSSKR